LAHLSEVPEGGPSEELRDMLVEIESVQDARLRAIFWPMAQWCREVVGMHA
jgi:hypothetical protein